MRAKWQHRLVGSNDVHSRVRTTLVQLEGAAPDQTPSNRSLYGNTHEIMRVMHIIALELARNEKASFSSQCVQIVGTKSSNRNKTVWNYGTKRERRRSNYVLPSVRKITSKEKKTLYKRITEMHENDSINFQIGYAHWKIVSRNHVLRWIIDVY